jgi:hypothetical protein
MLAEAKRASAFSYSIVLEPDPRSPIQFSDHADCNRALFLTLRPSSGLRASSPGGRPAPLSQRSIAIMAQDQEQGRERIHSPRHRPRLRRRALGAVGIGSGWPARVRRPGYPEPAAGAQSGLEGTDGSIGGRQAAGTNGWRKVWLTRYRKAERRRSNRDQT